MGAENQDSPRLAWKPRLPESMMCRRLACVRNPMTRRRSSEDATYDEHFAQGGFRALFKEKTGKRFGLVAGVTQ